MIEKNKTIALYKNISCEITKDPKNPTFKSQEEHNRYKTIQQDNIMVDIRMNLVFDLQ